MSRQKKSRKISDIMPVRKAEKKVEAPLRKGRKPTRYELDALAREEKRKKKRKGLPSGSRHLQGQSVQNAQQKEVKDPRIGSRKKIPLMVEEIYSVEQAKPKPKSAVQSEVKKIDPALELAQLENNECLNDLLDQLDAGKRLSGEDQTFVDDCLARIAELMAELGLDEEDEEEDLYRTFETIDINQFK